MAIVEKTGLHRITARVGRYSEAAGPDGTRRWASETVLRQTGETVTLKYQDVELDVYETAMLLVDGLSIHVYEASDAHLTLFDNTLPLVPTAHLSHVIQVKPQGFRCVGRAGIGPYRAYTGGLNAAADDRATAFDDRQAILITYGALWHDWGNGVCSTILHEVGHTVPGLSYATFDAQRTSEMRSAGTSGKISRNRRGGETLMNAYMNMLLAGSSNPAIQQMGVGSSIQNDSLTRDGLRSSLAFSSLPADWQARYDEARITGPRARRGRR